jgi:branched-chain amino acid transport system substrate-binding protein
MGTKRVLFCVVGILSMTLLFSGTVPAQQSGEPLRIGVLTEWTGVSADYGPKFQIVQDLFLNEVGQKMAGRPVKVFKEDTGTNPAMAADKARKLINIDKVHMLTGTIIGHISQTVASIAAEEKIPLVSWYAGHYEAVEKGWYFTTCPPPEVNTYALGKYAYDMGYRTVTALGHDFVAGHKFNGGTLQGFLDAGGKVNQKQWAPLGTADFGPYIAALKPSDFCLFWFMGQANLTFWKQYEEFGMLGKMPLVISEGDTIFNEWLTKVDPKKFSGKIRGRTSYTSDLDNALNKKFVAAFRAKTGSDPDAYDLYAYETWMLMTKVFEMTKGDTNPEKLRQAIRGISMVTPAGPVRISAEGFAFRPSYVFELATGKDGGLYKKRVREYPEQPLIRLRAGIAP